jgi:DNA polymerase-1
MRIIRIHERDPNTIPDTQENDWIYNGLDCVVTHEVLEALLPQLDASTSGTYDFSRALQGPALEMRMRGVLVDEARKGEVITEFMETIDRLEAQLQRLVYEGAGYPNHFNWRSTADQRRLFYEILELPPVRAKGHVSVDRKAREKIAEYLIAKPIVAHLNAMADLGKKISVLQTEVDSDGRIRTSYNIAGTSTGRFSSSLSEFGTGGNLQNVEESLRSIFVADHGYKFAKFDAKSGESYCVGALEWNLFKDGAFLDAVESGDVHTAVAKLCWPQLPWTGDPVADRRIADRDFYRHYSYRFMCKKLGHGSNYGGLPATLSVETNLPIETVVEFQPKYFSAFPAHRRWHMEVDSRLRGGGFLISLTGRKRWFLGRRDDPATLREAIAYDPQCSLSDLVNRAMLRLWRKFKSEARLIYIAFQDHDALTWTYPEEVEDELIPIISAMLVEDFPLADDRIMRIPYDVVTGWNKGEYCCGNHSDPRCKDCKRSANPNGLKEFHRHDSRRREETIDILDRVVRRRN